MRTSPKALLLLALALAVPTEAFAAARLTYTMSGSVTPVRWDDASFPLQYRVDDRVAAAVGSTAVIDRSFRSWSSIPDTAITFRQSGTGTGLKAGWDGENTVSVVDGLFRDQRFVALTTNWYDSTGKMTEADIQVDAELMATGYNVEQTLTHEIGHLLGLDHSAVLTSVMFPYVGRQPGSQPLDSDDRIAAGTIYPRASASSGATLKGRVTANGQPVFAAQVVAVNERGEPVVTGLSASSGDYLLEGVPPGTYRIYAEPLDGPVDARNLAGVWREAKVESFPSEFVPSGLVSVEAGKVYGNLDVDASGAPVKLNPRWVGRGKEGERDFTLSTTPLQLTPGERMTIAVGGDGFVNGLTTFEVMSNSFRRESAFQYAGNYVFATFVVSAAAQPGSAVILTKNGNESAMLTGAIRISGSAGRARSVR